MSKERTYYDQEGSEVPLDTLCRQEPAWAANCIRTLCERLDKVEAVCRRHVDDPDHVRGLTEVGEPIAISLLRRVLSEGGFE